MLKENSIINWGTKRKRNISSKENFFFSEIQCESKKKSSSLEKYVRNKDFVFESLGQIWGVFCRHPLMSHITFEIKKAK